MRGRLERFFLAQWYRRKLTWLLPLAPLGWLVEAAAARRLRHFSAHRETPPVPLLVVGNISVGGTGKTPVVIALVQAFAARGLKVVVISRGYGSAAPRYPFVVTAKSRVVESGDEPLLIARRTGVPVVIDADRKNALERALDFQPDVIISDDGLQHYALPRTTEVVVLDGERGIGNGHCLPAGPLRESTDRLATVDVVLINGGDFTWPGATRIALSVGAAINVATGATRALTDFAAETTFDAVAAIGNPGRFFATLERAGLRIRRHTFADHHVFSAADIAWDGDVLMTEKDAVKCQAFADARHWFLPVSITLPVELVDGILHRLGF